MQRVTGKKHSQRQPQSKSCGCQKKSAMTVQNKDKLKFCTEAKRQWGQHQHLSQWNTDRGHVALAVSLGCPSPSSAPAATSPLPLSPHSNRRVTEAGLEGWGEGLRHASQCKPGASACQPEEPSLFPGWHPRTPANSTLVSIYFHKQRSGELS